MTLSPTVEVNVICHLGRPWCPATCSLDVFPRLENKRPPETEIQSPEEMLHTINNKRSRERARYQRRLDCSSTSHDAVPELSRVLAWPSDVYCDQSEDEKNHHL